ncbi:MCP four helix bundle domain-containing protein [Pelomonas sp. V22]|uniref:methyl-accepting chemotaxis protein n=1 Tax=Pelomonas sp. V22 TaxID=2822139 RepID=UPI0024A81337|nr:methyl-accepting chemotaxis protein [Pelomonas sp. V22]MDI4634738.1 MCP four helix bundle domain-containing protein [Pelomonas sp. V22]
MNLNNLRVSSKLWGAILLLLVAMLLISGITLRRANSVHAEAMAAVNASHDLIEKSAVWKGMTETAVTRSMASSISSDPSVGELFKDNLVNDTPRVVKLREQITELAKTDADQAQLKKILANGGVLLAASKKAKELGAAGDQAGAKDVIKKEYVPSVAAYLGAIDDFVKLQKDKNEQAQKSATEAQQGLFMWSTLGALVVIGLGMFVAAALVRSIRQPLQQSADFAKAIADGDLTRSISANRSDEFGELLNALGQMNASLARMVGNVRSATDSIATASSEIATGNQDLSSRTEQTASNLQQTASSMEELTSTVRNTADSATTANQLVNSATEVARRGGEVVSQVVSTMDEINTSSKKISDIIGVIDGIAFQTNILALNAAVEAARAGEQGRGFAVVASEVRSLAQRSAEAAKEIKTLIGTSVEKVDSGSRLVATAGETMGEIVTSVQRVTDIIGEISVASGEQSSGIGQVNGAIAQLDQMTQQNAALVEQSAAAAISLREQATKLAEVVSSFRISGTGPAATTHRGPSPAPAPRPVSSPAPIKKPVVGLKKPASPPKPASSPRPAASPPAPRPTPPAADSGDWETF